MKTTDELSAELSALIEDRTGAISKTVQTMADEVNKQGRRITSLEESREDTARRIQVVEASTLATNRQLGELASSVRTVSDSQRDNAATVQSIKSETMNQSVILTQLRDDKVGRDAVAKASKETRGSLFAVAGLALTLLAAIGGGVTWLISERRAEHQQAPASAAVAPATPH